MGEQEKGKYSEYGEMEIGDKRLSKRLEKTMETLEKEPGLTVCSASSGRYEAKAIYRLLKNPKLTIEAMVKRSRERTIEKIVESGEKVILMPQDTTKLDYIGLKGCEGMGTYYNEASRGLLGHTSIAISEKGMTFGLMSQELWTRELGESGKASKRKSKSISEKESVKWQETMKKSMNGMPEDIMCVTVCDREGDIYELFKAAELEEMYYLVRIIQNRRTTETEKLLDYAKSLESKGVCVVQIPRDTRNNRKAREAKLSIKYSEVTIKAPYSKNDSITAWVVVAEEIDAPQGIEPIAWYLLTNVPVTGFEDACSRVNWYVQRWKIERFHYVLKEVCKVEKSQERNVERLKKLITIYSIISMNILSLMYLSRTCPDIPCDTVFEEDEWKLLYVLANESAAFPPSSPYFTRGCSHDCQNRRFSRQKL